MLNTQRLYLRNLRPDDVQALYICRNDPECSQYQRYDDTSLPCLQNFVATYAHCVFPSTEEEQHYAVVSRSDNKIAGDISIFFSDRDHCFTLGITIFPQYQQKGFAYELLSAVLVQLQTHYPQFEVVALIEKENKKSKALFQKLGFAEECYAPSIESYVFTKSWGVHT